MHYPPIETSVERLEVLAKLHSEENERFRSFLKGQNGRKIDLQVQRISSEVSSKIDCTACGNCCRHLCPCLSKVDLKRLSEGLNLAPEEVVEAYTEELEGQMMFKYLPCAFLSNNQCTVYQHRPETCASFPHLHKEHFISRLRSTIDNYGVCPIVFNTIERLKLELHFIKL